MIHSKLSGAYYEMGLEQGRALKEVGFSLPQPDKRTLRFARRCEKMVGQHTPELLDEIRGVADGAEIDYDAIMTLTTTAPFDPDEMPGCSIVAVMPERTLDGRMIIGRNFDMFEDVSKEGATTYLTYPEERYPSVGNCDTWVGRWDGLNEAGVFTATTALFLPGPKPAQPGLVGWIIGRHILDCCATLDAAVEFVESIPSTGSDGRLIADSSGNAVVIESSAEGRAIRYPEDGLLLLTNHALCPAFAGKDRDSDGYADSQARYNRLRELLDGATVIDVARVKEAMSDHEGGVCSHKVDSSGRKDSTIWSVVARPGERKADIAEGHPCRAPYRTVQF
jgi:predicted choloylglycine hydrolase